MKKLGITIILISLVFLVSACKTETDTQAGILPVDEVKDDNIIVDENQDSGSMIQNRIIELTSEGFNPKSLTIKQGQKVTWVNKISEETWPASAMHPTHKVYPGSDIEKCGTSEESNIFDACKGLKEGESYGFTFNEKGTWRYHDHLNIKNTGSIIVE
nr:hypothetical protein [Candidatus Woesearchaeota archaeon]